MKRRPYAGGVRGGRRFNVLRLGVASLAAVIAFGTFGSTAAFADALPVWSPSTPTSTNFPLGSADSFDFSSWVSGSPPPTFTTPNTLPTGVTLSAAGLLSGTPAAGTSGTYTLAIDATNTAGTAVLSNFSLVVTVPPSFAGNTPSSVTSSVGSAFSQPFLPYVSGYPTPTLSTPSTLPTGVTLGSNGVLSGTPAVGTGGSYNLTIQAANSSGNATTPFTLTVDEAPTINSAASTTFTAGSASTFTATASGGYPTAVTFSQSGGSFPGDLALSSAGVISGTPSASDGGTWTFGIKAQNSSGLSTTQSFTLTIDAAPAIISLNHVTFTVGNSGGFNVSATGYPAPTITETGALPSGVTLSSGGLLSGTPAAGTGGTYPVAITASNGIGLNATQSFTLTVNQSSTITSAATTTFTVGSGGTFSVTSSGFPSATMGESGTLPTGVTFTDNGNGTGTLAGTPGAGTGGTYSLNLSANNGIGTAASQSFTLTVDQAPAVTSGTSTTFTAGSAGSFSVTASGYPAPTFSETGALPSGVTLSAGGSLSGTPGAGTGGSYPTTITASNGVGTNATQSFTLVVDQSSAITSSSSATFTVSTFGTFSVTATGNPAPTFSESGALPSGLSLSAAGVLSGTPTVTGSFAITITASNGIGSNATQSFTILVDGPPSITSSSSTTFTAGSTGSFQITSTGGYPSSVTYSETGALPSGVTLSSAGVLSGTPAAGTGGTYPITISASNGVGSPAAQSFTLTVDAAPAITSASSTTCTTSQTCTFTVTTSAFPTPTISETGTLPVNLSFTDNGDGTATISGRLAPLAGGTYHVTINASNGIGSNASQSFTIVVDQPAAITSNPFTTFTAGSAGSFTVTANGYPAPTFSESGTLPAGVSFTSGGVLSGTTTSAYAGQYNLTITATNGIGTADQEPLVLTIDAAPQITSAASATCVSGASCSVPITATGYPAVTLTETGALPAGVSFNATGTSTASISGHATQVGVFAVTITGSNGVGTNATQSFTLTINGAPTFSSASSTTFTVGTAGSFTPTVTGDYPTTLSFSESGALPAGVTLNSSTGLLSGTPGSGVGGSYPLTLTVSNGIAPNGTQSFTLIVDQAPTITAPSPITTATQTTVGPVQLSATGYPVPTFSATTSLPAGLTLSSAGVVAGTPQPGTGGPYTITVLATNAVSSASTSLQITVDQAPTIATSTNLSTPYGQAANFTISVAAGTYPTPSFSVNGALPSGLSFVDLGNGTATLSGTPNNNVSGTTIVSLGVSNVAGSTTSPLSITVTGTPIQQPPGSNPTGNSGGGTQPSTGNSGTQPATTASNGQQLSPLDQQIAVRRAAAVATGGAHETVVTKGALQSTFDPIGKEVTTRSHGRLTKSVRVALGADNRFPTLGNVGPYGDCAVVADSSIVRFDHLDAKIAKVPAMTTNEALAEWADIDNGTGQSLTDLQLLDAWSSRAGLLGTHISGWVDLNTQNVASVKRAVRASGALYVSLVLPADQSFATTDVLDPAMSATTEVAGHALAVFGWTSTGFLAITWGKVMLIPYSWWTQYVTSAYALHFTEKTEGEEGRNQAQARSGDLIGQTELVANTPTPAGDLPSDYLGVLEELKASIRSARLRAMRSVNTELISLYWTIGRTILDRQDVQAWGAGVIGRLADDLRREFPEMRGLSRSNLYYMRQMATAWSSEAIVQQAVGRLPWGHLVLLLGQLDDQPTRDWYARQAVEHGWSRAILLNQIKAKLHLRVGAAENNFSEVMAPEDSELMAELVKDPYNFEFAGLAGSLSEHALEVSLVANVERLLLELGKGFTFYGRQVRLEIDGDEFFIDLLFYNVFLHRYIVVELKIDKFKPEYAGQLNFYVQAIDGELATDRDDPTIGILICADRSASVVRYAVKGMASPIAVARYELGGAASPAVLDALPSEEALLEVAEAVDREADGEDDHPRDLEA